MCCVPDKRHLKIKHLTNTCSCMQDSRTIMTVHLYLHMFGFAMMQKQILSNAYLFLCFPRILMFTLQTFVCLSPSLAPSLLFLSLSALQCSSNLFPFFPFLACSRLMLANGEGFPIETEGRPAFVNLAITTTSRQENTIYSDCDAPNLRVAYPYRFEHR